MLRNLNQSADGRRICGTPFVGLLAADVAQGFDVESLLEAAIDIGDPVGTLYRVQMLNLPPELRVNEDGSFILDGPDDIYTGSRLFYKTGVPQSPAGTWTIQIGEVLGQVSSDMAGTYSIVGRINSNLAGAYGILSTVSSDLPGSYAMQGRIDSDLACTYAIDDAFESVSSDMVASYAITGRVSSSLVAAYYISSVLTASAVTPTGRLSLRARVATYLRTR